MPSGSELTRFTHRAIVAQFTQEVVDVALRETMMRDRSETSYRRQAPLYLNEEVINEAELGWLDVEAYLEEVRRLGGNEFWATGFTLTGQSTEPVAWFTGHNDLVYGTALNYIALGALFGNQFGDKQKTPIVPIGRIGEKGAFFRAASELGEQFEGIATNIDELIERMGQVFPHAVSVLDKYGSFYAGDPEEGRNCAAPVLAARTFRSYKTLLEDPKYQVAFAARVMTQQPGVE